MADVDEALADTAEKTLYDLIVEETGIEYDEELYTGVEEYKNNIVRHCGKLPTDEFEGMNDDVQIWVNAATKVFNTNRKSKTKEPLPVIDGLAEPEPEGEPKRRRGRPRRNAEAEPEEKPARAQRDPDANRYGRVMPHFMKDREISLEDLKKTILDKEGADYSVVTLERALLACTSIVGWLERNGYTIHKR